MRIELTQRPVVHRVMWILEETAIAERPYAMGGCPMLRLVEIVQRSTGLAFRCSFCCQIDLKRVADPYRRHDHFVAHSEHVTPAVVKYICSSKSVFQNKVLRIKIVAENMNRAVQCKPQTRCTLSTVVLLSNIRYQY